MADFISFPPFPCTFLSTEQFNLCGIMSGEGRRGVVLYFNRYGCHINQFKSDFQLQ